MKPNVRRGMHVFFKIFIIFMIATAVLNVLLFTGIYINHKNKLADEEKDLIMPGEIFNVNGHSIHVIDEGDKTKPVMVFIHSEDVTDDSVALEPLFEELKDEYRIVYIDRSGFGFSEDGDDNCDIDILLENLRSTLKTAGVDGPYILFTSGTGGIEAVYWADKYPDEVTGIIGVTMNYPEQFKDVDQDEYCGFFDYLMVKFFKIGGQRLMSGIYPDNEYGIYSETQMKTRKALYSKMGYTQNMYNESLSMVNNANKTAALGWPKNTKMYIVYSNPFMEPYVNEDESVSDKYKEAVEENPDVDYVAAYNESTREYLSAQTNVTFEEMAGPARLYTYCPKALAESIKNYVNNELLQ